MPCPVRSLVVLYLSRDPQKKNKSKNLNICLKKANPKKNRWLFEFLFFLGGGKHNVFGLFAGHGAFYRSEKPAWQTSRTLSLRYSKKDPAGSYCSRGSRFHGAFMEGVIPLAVLCPPEKADYLIFPADFFCLKSKNPEKRVVLLWLLSVSNGLSIVPALTNMASRRVAN